MTTQESRRPRARLSAYAPWILRDYFTNQGPSTVIVILLIGVLTILPVLHGPQGRDLSAGRVPEDIANGMLRALMPIFVFIATFFATNGIVANDRKFAYYKFLFAKPLNPVAYYVVTFLLYGLGIAIITALLLAAWSLAIRPGFPLETFAVVAIIFLAFGGLGFLLSAAWRFDWLSLVTVLFVSNELWRLRDSLGAAKYFPRFLLYLLPPVHKAGDVYSLLFHDGVTAVRWGSIAWLAGYGAMCLALGMLVIRRRPLGTN
jgi:hypothetical protein